MNINNCVAISDLHCGCRAGLFPCDLDPPLMQDMGTICQPSDFQREMWNAWKIFWSEWVPDVCHGEKFVLVVNGDGIDGRHHGAVTQMSQNTSDQKRIAKAILKPVISNPQCAGFYWIRGTEAHVGPSAELEDPLAEELGAIPDKHRQYSRYALWLRLGGSNGCLIHFMHHIGVTGRTHYETSAVMAEVAEMYTEAGRWGNAAADIIVRSHRHRYIEVRAPSARGYTIGVVTPGWQGHTPFTRKIAGARQTEPQFGGVVIRQGDKDHYTRSFVVSVAREPEVIACSQ